MAEQCPQPQAHPARCGCEQAREADWRNALRTANEHTRQLMVERDALHQQVEEWKRRCQYNADTAHDVASERDQLRAELEAARGLLSRAAEYMRNSALIIDSSTYRISGAAAAAHSLRTLAAELTATLAPEVRQPLSGNISDQEWIDAGCPPEKT